MTGFKVFAFSSTFWGLIRCCCGVGQFQEAHPESCRDVFCHGITRVFQIPQQTTNIKICDVSQQCQKIPQNSQLDIVCFVCFLANYYSSIWICIFHHIYIYIYVTKTREDKVSISRNSHDLKPRRSCLLQAVALVDEAFGLQKGHR